MRPVERKQLEKLLAQPLVNRFDKTENLFKVSSALRQDAVFQISALMFWSMRKIKAQNVTL